VSFLLQSDYRSDSSGTVFYFGGEESESVESFPTYGLSPGELSGILGTGARVIGDRVFMSAGQRRGSQLKQELAKLGARRSITLELYALDVGSVDIDRLNEWLDQFRVGVGYVSRGLVETAVGGAVGGLPGGAQFGQQRSVSGPRWDVQVDGLLSLLETLSDSRMELRQQVQVLSGSISHFESGEVVETPLIIREPETGQDLVSRVERRTVGLELQLGATAWDEVWSVDVEISDSSFAGGSERSTSYRGGRIIGKEDRMVQLASFTREVVEERKQAVPVLGKLPGAMGRAFTKSSEVKQRRQFILLARRVSE
jgi:hypothetical protein